MINGDAINKQTERKLRKKAAMEQNEFGPRLFWVRTKLKLKVSEVVESVGLPEQTLRDWENGVRTRYWEGIKALSLFYSELWNNKFKDTRPLYKGEEVEITYEFLQFGKDLSLSELKKENEDLYKKLTEMEVSFAFEREELKSQLNFKF